MRIRDIFEKFVHLLCRIGQIRLIFASFIPHRASRPLCAPWYYRGSGAPAAGSRGPTGGSGHGISTNFQVPNPKFQTSPVLNLLFRSLELICRLHLIIGILFLSGIIPQSAHQANSFFAGGEVHVNYELQSFYHPVTRSLLRCARSFGSCHPSLRKRRGNCLNNCYIFALKRTNKCNQDTKNGT